MTHAPVRWGLLATGAIAEEFAEGLARTPRAELVAVGSRDGGRAREFGARHGVAPGRAYGSYEELIADDGVDVLYVSTPHTDHGRWAIAAARAGRGVLCEKPLTVAAAEAEEVVAAARAADVFLMEAFMYRFHPQIRRMVEIVASGRLGEVRSVAVDFGFRTGPDTPRRVIARELAGGGILDVGCYCTSVARLVAGTALGVDAAEPRELSGHARLHPVERVDVGAHALLEFDGGIHAHLQCALDTPMSRIAVHGEDGRLEIDTPPWRLRGTEASHIVLTGAGGAVERVEIASRRTLMEREAEVVADHLAARQVPEMSWAESLANMRTLDRWRAAAGVDYGDLGGA